MKKLSLVLIAFLVFACNSENANDCFQAAGNIIQKEFSVDVFDKILVNRDITLILKEGPVNKVVVETGENLLNDISALVTNGQLILTDANTCNFVRDYGITKVYITAPNISQIRSSTQYDIISDGLLTYPNLTLLSEDFGVDTDFTIGNFRLEIDNESLSVIFNNLSNCFVEGQTNNLSVSFFAGNSRFEGENLTAQHVVVSHRGSNDMIIRPVQSLKGIIRGTGNVISKNTPPVIDIDELYQGRLVFE